MNDSYKFGCYKMGFASSVDHQFDITVTTQLTSKSLIMSKIFTFALLVICVLMATLVSIEACIGNGGQVTINSLPHSNCANH